jgi:signal transduction histidine kinase
MRRSIAALSRQTGLVPTCWRPSRLLLALACLLIARGVAAAASDAAAPFATAPQILVVFSDDASQSWIHEMTDAMNEVVDERTGDAPAWYFEYLDALRFQDQEHEREFGAAIRNKYRDRRMDLIVPIASNAITFAATARQELWPEVPVLAAEYGGAQTLARIASQPKTTTLAFEYGLPSVLATMKQVFPDTTGVAVSYGVSAAERRRESGVAAAVRSAGFDLVEIAAPTLAGLLERVANLPERTVLFLAGGQLDSNGTALPTWRMCETLSKAANRPALMLGSQFLGCGIVGGLMRDYAKIGTIIGQRALAAASGPGPANETVPFSAIATLAFDARQLARWNVDESRLPSGSSIAFRRPSLWRDYRREVLIIAAAGAMQSVLIAGLLYERRHRHQAELESRRSLALAAHADRRVAMAALSGSIAHELGQPLGAILHNASAAELMLTAEQLPREELREILHDIRADDDRAAQIVQRHRAMLQKHELERRAIDLHAVIRDSLALIAHEVLRRAITLDVRLPDTPCIVSGDRILLQQVIVNLVSNAIDAMAETPTARRRIVVRSQTSAAMVTVSIRDYGSGLPPDVEQRLFEPYFTTKPDGTGIGLTIVRRIIDAHEGTIEARNNSDGGASFWFNLAYIQEHQGVAPRIA